MVWKFGLGAMMALVMVGCQVPGSPIKGGVAEDPESFSGPLPLRSMMPLSLIFPHPPPEKAVPLQPGQWEASLNNLYASVLVKAEKGMDRFWVDGEFLRSSLYLKRGFSERLEIGLELPFVHYSSGFLDHTIEEFHDTFGFPQGRRDRNRDDQYSALYQNQGTIFFRTREDGLHLADIPVYVKLGLIRPEASGFGLALRGTLELPTGNSDSGYGSGGVEGGLGVIAQHNFDASLAGYLNVDHILRSNPSSFRGVKSANVTHGSLALEKAFSDSISLVAQTDYQTRALRGVHLGELRDPEWTGSLGLGWKAADAATLRFFFSEGITTHSAPDFVLGLSFGLVF